MSIQLNKCIFMLHKQDDEANYELREYKCCSCLIVRAKLEYLDYLMCFVISLL